MQIGATVRQVHAVGGLRSVAAQEVAAFLNGIRQKSMERSTIHALRNALFYGVLNLNPLKGGGLAIIAEKFKELLPIKDYSTEPVR